MLVAVAERLYARRFEPGFAEERRAAWAEDPLRAMLETAAMPPGLCRTRLHSILGLDPDRVVNLLAPDEVIGSWEPTEARANAFRLAGWARPSGARCVLLGRRVAEAFNLGEVPFGMSSVAWGVPCVVCPHPSGRSRYLNDRRRRFELRRVVRRFMDLERRSTCER